MNWRGACSPRWNAGTSRSTIPAATRSLTRRQGDSRASQPRRRLEVLPRLRSSHLLKHPLTRLGAGEGANTRAVAALERAVLRGPRPKAKSSGLTHALATFREELGKFRRGEQCDLHPSDPRVYLRDGELVDAAVLLEQFTAAIAPLENLSGAPRAFAELAARHCDVVTALSSNEHGQPAAFTGNDGVKLFEAFDDIARANADAGFVVAQADYAELFRIAIADRVARRPEVPNVRVRIYGPLEARLQNCRSRRPWRPGRGHLAAGDAAGSRGSAVPCAMRSASICRSGAFRCRHTISRRRSALTRSSSPIRPSSPVLQRWYRASSSGWPPSPAKHRWEQAREKGRTYLAWARALDHPAEIKRMDKPAPQAAARRAADSALGHGDRKLAARPLHHLCQAYSQTARARRRRPATGRCRPRHRHPRCAQRVHQDLCRGAAGRSRRGADRDRRQAFRHARRLSRGAGVLVATLPAHRALVRRLGDAAARLGQDAQGRNVGPDRDPAWRARVHAARARRPHRRACGRWPCHSRLQDRTGADREAGAHRRFAAAHARSRDPARRRISRYRRRCLGERARLCRAEGRRARRRRKGDQVQGG